MAKGRSPRGESPRAVRAAQIPDTWLGGSLRASAGVQTWPELIGVLSDVGTAFPELAEFAVRADLVLAADPGSTAEEVLKAWNSARMAAEETPMDVLHLIGIVHQAMQVINRQRCEAVMSRWEERIAEALCASAAERDGIRSVQDRKTFFTMRGLLKPDGARVTIDARRMAPKADLAGAPAVEAGNLAFQGLLDGPGESEDEPNAEED